MSRFIFGEKIIITATLKRVKGQVRNPDDPILPDSKEFREHQDDRTWVKQPLNEPESAIFLGERRLSNGRREIENYGEDGYNEYFDHKEYLKGAWICRQGKNPEKVLLEDCKHIEK